MRAPASKHEFWMQKAITLAQQAERHGDRPFGCVIVVDHDPMIVGSAAGTGINNNPLRHSECEAIRQACARRQCLLEGCTLYSTHEPCHMCAGAILHAHISEVVWGSWRADIPQLFRDYWVGTESILEDSSHRPRVTTGVLRDECIHLFDAELSELANARAGF